MMWNAKNNPEAVYKEWLQVTYGPAWKIMDRFYMTIEKEILRRKMNEPLAYSGNNYEVNYDFVDDVYKPIFPVLEKLFVRAERAVQTPKQKKRLAMLGDNLCRKK
jgi:hypothetical protein